MNRREFLSACAGGYWLSQGPGSAGPAPFHYRRAPPYEAYVPLIRPGHDEFPEEAAAMELEQALQAWSRARHPAAEARFAVLAHDLVRFEFKEPGRYRTGFGHVRRLNGRVDGIAPVEEYTAASERPLFRDVTGAIFAGVPSFHDQLARGIPYWTAKLDPATGIDIYGNQGIAAGDIDNDGVDEIFVCQPGGLPNRLYKLANGRFTDISASAGVDLLDATSSALFLDLRNTGRQDLVVLLTTGPLLFLNDGGGVFHLRENAFTFASPPQGTFTGMAAADYDRDGKLDLYICSYLFFQSEAQYRYPVPYHDARNGPPNYLFRNRLDARGDGGFEDVTAASGMHQNNDRFTFAAAWCDYDNDGWPDLYVANDFGRKNLYKNEQGRFHDVAAEAGVEDTGPGMSAAWFDYDGDGKPDLYVANMWSAAGQRIVASPGFPMAKDPSLADAYRRHAKGNSLYRNIDGARFAEDNALAFGRWAWSSDAHDFDCDGWPEVFIAAGMMTNQREPDLMSFFWRQVVAKSPADATPAAAYESGWNALNQFLREGYSWNGHESNVFLVRRDGRYRDFSGVSGLDVAEDGRAFAVTDLTGDGSLDLILKSRLGPQVRVFENASAAGRGRLVLRLRGVTSNRDAIGAKVVVDGQAKWLAAGSGYLSQNTKLVHFGLDARETAQAVTIHWPSGAEQTFEHLDAGHLYEIVEGQSEVRKIPLKPPSPPRPAVPVNADNRPALSDTWFLEPIPLPDKRPGPGLVAITSAEPADTLAAYSLFRRYLFEWRVDLDLPLYLLVDGNGLARKIYAARPAPDEVRADLRRQGQPLPFAGRSVTAPRRDFFKMGAALFWSGYPEQALPYLEAALNRAQNARTLVLVAQIHADARRTAEARSLLARALALEPASPEAWNELGAVESAEGHAGEGLKCFLNALELKPDLPYATLNAAQAYAELGDDVRAGEYYRRALALEPGSADAANGLGLALAKQNRVAEAKQAFERAIELRPQFGSAINNLGVLYITTGDFADAVAAFRYGMRAAPDEDDLYMNLAAAYLHHGEPEKARQVVQQWLERKPASERALRALRALDR